MDNKADNRPATRIGDWVSLPLAVLFLILGIGVLTGLIYKNNALLQGSTRFAIGLLLSIYGLVRSIMISRRLSR
jgi:hypothetical protein